MRELYKSASKFSVKHACIIIVIMKVRERRRRGGGGREHKREQQAGQLAQGSEMGAD